MWGAPQGNVYLAPGVTDMRKSLNTLALMVVETPGMEPVGPHRFVFCGRERDKLKILQWDTNGFWLHYRRLEQGRFVWPRDGQDQAALQGAPAALAARWLAVAERSSTPVDGAAPRLLTKSANTSTQMRKAFGKVAACHLPPTCSIASQPRYALISLSARPPASSTSAAVKTGSGVTIDAMGCQREIDRVIVDQKADYVLALKENHPSLHDDVKLWLDDSDAQGHVRMHETVEKDHGRIETRRTVVSTALDWLAQKPDWPGLQAVAMVESTREMAGKISCERRDYLCSLRDVARIALTIRHHWAIVNQQHWILDVQFGEDAHRTRKDHSAANLGPIRRAALNLLQQDTSNKWSIRRRKMRSLVDLTYREALLFKNEQAKST